MYAIRRFKIALLMLVLLTLGASIASSQRARAWLDFRSSSSSTTRLAKIPPVVVWAWERPESLDYIDTTKVSVAFLAKTVYFSRQRVMVRPRLQPLTLPQPQTALIAVTRIECDSKEQPAFSAQLNETAREISDLATLRGVVALQVDFDATLSQRSFYRNLLFELRRRMPETTALQITALASWCKGDNWLEDLPIDEAVPMLFRMGIERNQIVSQLSGGEPFRSSKCRNSVGISTDEPIPNLPPTQRVYVFNPKQWSRSSVEQLLSNYDQAHEAP